MVWTLEQCSPDDDVEDPVLPELEELGGEPLEGEFLEGDRKGSRWKAYATKSTKDIMSFLTKWNTPISDKRG